MTKSIRYSKGLHAGVVIVSTEWPRLPDFAFLISRSRRIESKLLASPWLNWSNREDPDSSVLLLKPTNRTPHSGGERIGQGTPEEAALRSWISVLTKISGKELAAALRYQQEEAAGHGVVPRVVLRRLSHNQYNRTVLDLLGDATNAARQFPPEVYVDGFKNQYAALSAATSSGRGLQFGR